jgi:hypothetical protein
MPARAAPAGIAAMEERSTAASRGRLRRLFGALRRTAWPIWPFMPLAAAAHDPAPTTCTACGGDHNCLVEWRGEGDSEWWIRMRCGDCGTYAELVIGDARAVELEAELGRQLGAMRCAADRLDSELMAAEVAAFTAALHADDVTAADF